LAAHRHLLFFDQNYVNDAGCLPSVKSSCRPNLGTNGSVDENACFLGFLLITCSLEFVMISVGGRFLKLMGGWSAQVGKQPAFKKMAEIQRFLDLRPMGARSRRQFVL